MSRIISAEYHQTFQTLLDGVQESLTANDIEISEDFVVMMVKLASLDPPNKFLIKQQMVQSELDRMKKIVVDRILSMSPLCRNIISMQLHYRMNYYRRDESIEIHREDQEQKIRSLMDDIKSGIPNNLKHYDVWYAKLIAATIIEADMGPAAESSVVEETEAALSSAFPKDDINLLSSMTIKDRETELYHLMHITIGIRLFTKDKSVDDYGMFIEDLPKIIPKKIEKGLNLMTTIRTDNIKRLITYTMVVQPYFLRHLAFRMGRRAVSSDMIHIRQALVMVHQALIYLKELTDDLNHEKEMWQQLIEAYSEAMKDLHSTVQKNKNVPKTILYPKFVELYDAWRDLQECHIFVDSISEISKAIGQFIATDLKEMDKLATTLLGDAKVLSEKEFFNFPATKIPDDKYALAKRVDFPDDLDPLQMSFTGFCIHSFVKGVGLLVLSNPQLGVFNWKNQNYLLSTAKAAVEFRRDPDSFIRKAYAIARRWPELIALLNIDKDAFDPATISDADRSRKTTNVLISSEAETQTELHPTSSRIVKHYTWNEWELRRRGLILSKIHKCRTHSTQTHWQALKQNAEVQTFSNKGTPVQTNTNAYSEIPLSQFYIYGLRGLHCEVPPHVVELTQENPTDLKCVISKKLDSDVAIDEELPFMSQLYNCDCL